MFNVIAIMYIGEIALPDYKGKVFSRCSELFTGLRHIYKLSWFYKKKEKTHVDCIASLILNLVLTIVVHGNSLKCT